MLKGVLIKECITDENIIDGLQIENVEIWDTGDTPRFWTAIHFATADVTFPKRLSKCMAEDWYCDMKYKDNIKVIVFSKKVLQYTIGNEVEKQAVIKQCKKMGVPKNVLNWSE